MQILKRSRGRGIESIMQKNKDEVNKKRRQARELKKRSTGTSNDENTLCDLPATGQSGVTQLLVYKTPTGGQGI